MSCVCRLSVRNAYTVRRRGSAMVLLDRATATLPRLLKVTTFLSAAVGGAILNAALLPAAVTHRIVSIC